MAGYDKKMAENSIYLDIEKNAKLVVKLLAAYYSSNNHAGKMYDNLPQFFLVRPQGFEGENVAVRDSDKLLLGDCIERAKARDGYLGISKFHNPKLSYYWLELSVMPFVLGDEVNDDNKGEFFYIVARFIEFTKQHPGFYGDLTAEIESDKDVTLILSGINHMADQCSSAFKIYPEDKLVSYDATWPVAEVKKLLLSLKDNDQDWCELFFEYLIYVMEKKLVEYGKITTVKTGSIEQ